MGRRMAVARLVFFLSAAVAAVAAAGCGGGGGGPVAPGTPGGSGAPSPVTTTPVTTTPGATPTSGATPTPSGPASGTPVAVGAPSPLPSALTPAQGVTARPLASGDRFTYSGRILTTFVYAGTNPKPTSTTFAAVTQSVVLGLPAAAGGAAQIDVATAETDTAPLATTTSTTDAFEGLIAVAGGRHLAESSSVRTDSGGDLLTVTYPTPLVLDALPETAGASFTNGPARTIDETSPGKFQSKRTYAPDGSYTDSETYPAVATAGGSATPSATIVEYHDGHGLYTLPLQGSAGESTIAVGTPAPVAAGAAGQAITLTRTAPDPAVSPVSRSVPVWYAQPLQLSTETDRQTGAKPLPAACNVPGAIATSANALVTTIERVDTVLGSDETVAQISYVAPTYGLVCLQMTDTTKSFYDLSGQSLDGVAVSGSATIPLETATVQATLGLTAATLAAAPVAPALAVTSLRGTVEAAVTRVRAERLRRTAAALAARAGAAR